MQRKKMMSNYDQLSLAENQFSAHKKQARVAATLEQIKLFVDWEGLEKTVQVIDKTQQGKGGRPRIPLQWMLRMVFVQHLYNLSDPELEDQMIDRKSFQKFVGIHQGIEIPDFSSLWRFKEALIEHKLENAIFNLIIGQLELKGLIIKKGTAVDATIIQSTTRPLSKEKRKQMESEPSKQIDTDAASTEKAGKKYFGYKGHIGVDIGSKLIRKHTFTTASPHDSTEFENVLSGDETSIWADSGYVNKKLKRAARTLGIYFGVIDRGARNHPLSNSQKKRNRKKSAVRAVVEHPFALIKSKLHYTQATAKNKQRNSLRFTLNCAMYNVLRANYLIKKQLA
ncbi:MAG: IS5 family transposase [Chitinophagales bacterium]